MSSTPRAGVLVALPVLVDETGDVVSGASALVVDALRRGLPVAVFSTDRDATAALEGSWLLDALDHVTGADAVGADPATVAQELVDALDAPPRSTLVLVTDGDLGHALAATDVAVTTVGGDHATWGSTAEVRLEHHPEVASARVELEHGVALLDGWSVEVDAHEPDQVVTVGSNLMTGNGFLGYRGTAPEWDARADVACIVTDTWDEAVPPWRELVSAPNALRVRWWLDGELVGVPHDEELHADDEHHRRLDMLLGRTVRRLDHHLGVTLADERFASLDELGLVAQRSRIAGPPGTRVTVELAVDGDVWDLNGPHLPDLTFEADGAQPDGVPVVHGRTVESDVHVAVAQAARLRRGRLLDATLEVDHDARVVARRWEVELVAPDGAVLDLFMGVAHDNGGPHNQHPADPVAEARRIATEGRDTGYAPLLARQDAAWRRVWDASDVEVEGDPTTQASLRFGTYHNVIATPRHDARLPIGARGLSCQAYQGAAFWDQEVFNLPMYLHTQPDVARGLVQYRIATLDGARRKADHLGYRGAFFAWVSGRTGDELCPDFFFEDVSTGRPIRNHFNDWQIHVAPDVALTVERYVDVTGDDAILDEGGATLVFEVARFLEDRVWHDHREDRCHLLRLLGPDEWHENVDDNAFTAYQAEAALRLAVRLWDEGDDGRRDGFARDERDAWLWVADRLHLPKPDPDTLVIEQFAGYHDLEDVPPSALEERLAHPDEYWGWPNGVAVHTQVLKQADVVQLLALRPELFDDDVAATNVDHYLPRTAHGSSLSKGTHALVLARLGRAEEARTLFLESATVDLLSRRNAAPGGTFIGGIRTAAAAMSWQVVVLGFLGLDVDGPRLVVTPRLHPSWSRVATAVVHRGVRARVTVTPDAVVVLVDDDAPGTLPLRIVGEEHELGPGEQVEVARR